MRLMGMQANLQRIRQNQVTTQLRTRPRTATFASAKCQARQPPALVYPIAIINIPATRDASSRTLSCSCPKRWNPSNYPGSWGSAWEPVGKGTLGQVREWRYFSTTNTSHDSEKFNLRITRALSKAEAELMPEDVVSWRRLFTHMRDKHGSDGTWACFELLRDRHRLHIVLRGDSDNVRESIIDAASVSDTRLETLLEVVIRLKAFSQTWPDFYVNVVHLLLRKRSFDRALKWHMILSRQFPPEPDLLGGLLSSFITDPRPDTQSTLTSIYVSSAEHKLYDRIIPVLYNSGNSLLARVWRKTMVELEDYPSSSSSLAFLDFLSRYYPRVKLTAEELSLVNRKGTTSETDLPKRGIYGDGFVAKWFASTWLSVEFAINFVRRIGLQTVGPQSLQAIALREENAEGVAARISQLDRLGICVAPQTYCKALVFFARNGEDKLLSRLLHTDVHPDEFEDKHTRNMIMADAVVEKDWERQELFQGVEWAVENEANTDYLNDLLRDVLRAKKLGKAKIIVDRMGALGVNITQKNAATLLSHVFWLVGKHPTRWKRKVSRGKPDVQLDRAIDITRKIASHKIAIPCRYWESLIYSLGRWGRFEELLQLSGEIVQLFKPPGGGLVPVYRQDLPQESQPDVDPVESTMRSGRVSSAPKYETKSKSKRKSRQDGVEDTQHIPADLPFKHMQHPLRKLFDAVLQRNIIRWGFDQTLARRPTISTLTEGAAMRVQSFDIACGVKILASLRDHGVPIDWQILQSTIATRVVLGQVPSRRHRSRDSQDVTTEHVKSLVDRAWGSEVLPSLPELNRLVEQKRLGVWKRYPILFQSTNGEGFAEHDELDEI